MFLRLWTRAPRTVMLSLDIFTRDRRGPPRLSVMPEALQQLQRVHGIPLLYGTRGKGFFVALQRSQFRIEDSFSVDSFPFRASLLRPGGKQDSQNGAQAEACEKKCNCCRNVVSLHQILLIILDGNREHGAATMGSPLSEEWVVALARSQRQETSSMLSTWRMLDASRLPTIFTSLPR